MELFKNQFVSINYNPDTALLDTIWFEASEDMEEVEYKEIIEKRVTFFERYKPKNFLTDARHFRYIIKPSLQAWNYEHSLKLFSKLGGKKIAVLNSEDFVAQVSIEQTVEQDTQAQTEYFDDINSALKWLNS